MSTSENNEADELADEEELYTRGRSRSRSVHAADSMHESSDNPGNIVTPIDPSSYVLQNKTATEKSDKSAERTGPLQQREVVALKKGLQEQTVSRNRDEVREEEEERRAAVVEKHSRTAVTSSQALIGSDPPMKRVKILMLGDSGVGKSCLINRWTQDTFCPTLVSTVGVDFKAKKVNLDGEIMNVQVWDTAGQENFHKITQSYYKGANGIMVVFDVSDVNTLGNVEYWIKNIKKHASDSVHVALVGNKTDLRALMRKNPAEAGKVCDTNAGRSMAVKFGIPYFETSAKESENVDEAYMTVLQSIVCGDAHALPAQAKPKGKTIMQKMEKSTGSGLTIFNLGKANDKLKSLMPQKEKDGDDTSSTSSTLSSNGSSNSNGGAVVPGRRNSGSKDKKEDCTIS